MKDSILVHCFKSFKNLSVNLKCVLELETTERLGGQQVILFNHSVTSLVNLIACLHSAGFLNIAVPAMHFLIWFWYHFSQSSDQ